MPRRAETDLYEPVKRFLLVLGYSVKSEVKGCDVVGLRNDQTVVVELKPRFTLALVLQGIDRQRLTQSVYLAVEAPGPRSSGPAWKDILHLCRRLGLGLLTVSFRGHTPRVDVACDPMEMAPRRNRKASASLLEEFRRRSADHNIGGSARRPLITAYREEALKIALYLREIGPSSTRAIRAATRNQKAAEALQQNYYGWFERRSRGVYQLTEQGLTALQTYAEVVNHLAST